MITAAPTENEVKIKAVQDRRFACPGLFRMPLANDGGICRIKLPLGRLTSEQIDGIADAAETFSCGYVELTTRANVQIRAVAKNNQQKLINKILDLGLGPLTPEGDDIRNVMVAPTAGIDVDMSCNTVEFADKLLAMLQLEKNFASLSPKFSFLINGGETTQVLNHKADIWLSAHPDGKAYNFGFASSALDMPDSKSPTIGSITEKKALEFIRYALGLFISITKTEPSISRMKHLCVSGKFKDFLAQIYQHFGNDISKPLMNPELHENLSTLTGILPQKQKDLFYVGARPALGRMASKTLHGVAGLARIRALNTPVRLTHYQGIIIPDCSRDEATLIRDGLSKLGLATDENNPALYVYCCAGAPLCHSALSNVQRDGKYLVEHFSGNPKALVHLTACSKSCVATEAFPFTILAVKDGIYNLYRANLTNETEKNKFGQLLCENMSISDVMRYIENEK